MDKDKCRICLKFRKNLSSIFDRDRAISYADMITSLANVKIVKDERITESLCRMCRRKLVEAYEFTKLIESSDLALYEATNMKKIYFSNINDIKIKIEIEPNQVIPKCENMKEYFKEGVYEVFYSDTVIKKLDNNNSTNDLALSGRPIPVLDFLKIIKDEPFDDNNENYDFTNYSDGADTDDNYVPPYRLIKKTKRKYKKHQPMKTVKKANTTNNNSQSKGQIKHVCIKPVLMSDLKYVYSKKQKSNKKQVSHARVQMCPHCGIMTKTLKIHILQHTGERNYKCDECGKGFLSNSSLINHKKRHDPTKNFTCDQCVAAFNDKSALKSHMRSHSENCHHVCDVCSKAFKRKGALRRHRMMHNSANKSIMCERCNMSFYTNTALRHHMRVHTGERPFNCEICSQPYSYKHDFNRHCFKKHGVFLKRRSVYVMNEEVLKQERTLMKELLLRVNGVIKDGKPINPFEGPQAAQAFELAVKALEARQIPIDI